MKTRILAAAFLIAGAGAALADDPMQVAGQELVQAISTVQPAATAAGAAAQGLDKKALAFIQQVGAHDQELQTRLRAAGDQAQYWRDACVSTPECGGHPAVVKH